MELNKKEKNYHITKTKHNILIKKTNNLITYANNHNTIIDKDFLQLANFVKMNNYMEINYLQARKIEEFTKYYCIPKGANPIIASANELIRYAKQNNIKLCNMFFDDLEKIKNNELKDEKLFIKTLIRKYVEKVWRENNLENVEENYYYLMSKIKNKKVIQRIKINKPIDQVELKGRHKKLFDRIENAVNIPKIINEVKKDSNADFETINTVLYNSLEENTIKYFLYGGRYKVIRNFIIKKVSEGLYDLTKHDKDIDPSTLTKDEIIQAFNNSISKFMELYYQIPQDYKPVLKNYDVSVVENEIIAIQSMIINNDDMKFLKKLFRAYKEDMQGLLYNYSLFGFIYYIFSVKVSNKYLFNSQILKSLNLYKIEKDRKKPTIKKNAITALKTQQIIYKELGDKESVFIDNLIVFLEEYIPKKYNYYSIAYLTNELENSLEASKNFIESLDNKCYKKLTRRILPEVINTILPPVEKLICT